MQASASPQWDREQSRVMPKVSLFRSHRDCIPHAATNLNKYICERTLIFNAIRLRDYPVNFYMRIMPTGLHDVFGSAKSIFARRLWFISICIKSRERRHHHRRGARRRRLLLSRSFLTRKILHERGGREWMTPLCELESALFIRRVWVCVMCALARSSPASTE